MNGDSTSRALALLLYFMILLHLENRLIFSMPKFFAGCHYNEEEISRHLGIYIYIYIGCWPVQINDNKFATGRSLKKRVEVVKGWIFS